MRVLVNAIHTKSGGGLAYLCGVLPHLANSVAVREVVVLVHKEVADTLPQIPTITYITPDVPQSTIKLLVWEQLYVPYLQRKYKCGAVWCNANYGPWLSKNMVVTIHNNPAVARYVDSVGAKLYWFVLVQFTRVSIAFGKGAVTVAEHIVPRYARGVWRYLSRKVAYAPPAVTVPESIVKSPVATPTICAVGDIYPQKNYAVLLAAITFLKQELPHLNLTIIGRPYDRAEYARLQAYVHDNALTANVTFTEGLPHADVLHRIAMVDVLCAPSVVECFNMPVLEALALGTPCVCGDYPFQREVAANAAVYVTLDEGGDVPAALATALLGVLTTPEIQAQLRREGLKHASTFSWQKTAESIIAQLRK